MNGEWGDAVNRLKVEAAAERVELARGIEPPTCGLQNSDRPTSGNVTPQETTKQDAGTDAADGASLSCPGSSVVADCDKESERVEAATAPETMGPGIDQSLSAQSLPDDHEIGTEP